MENLGRKAKDKITGFEGIIVAKITYLTGCDQYGVVPPVDKEGKIGDIEWLDQRRLTIKGKAITPTEVQAVDNPGGPNRDAPR